MSGKNNENMDEYILDLQENYGYEEFEDMEVGASNESVKDPSGRDMFSLVIIKHPRSGEQWPMEHVAKFIKTWIKKPLDREMRRLMRAE